MLRTAPLRDRGSEEAPGCRQIVRVDVLIPRGSEYSRYPMVAPPRSHMPPLPTQRPLVSPLPHDLRVRVPPGARCRDIRL